MKIDTDTITKEQILEKIQKLFNESEINVLIAIESRNNYDFFTNGCLRCFTESLQQFVENRNIPHAYLLDSEENSNETKH